jgi:hypothetical protein
MLDEGFRCLYSLLLTGKPIIIDTVWGEQFVHVFTDEGFIHLNFAVKKLAVYGTKFSGNLIILPAAGDYSISIIENYFHG